MRLLPDQGRHPAVPVPVALPAPPASPLPLASTDPFRLRSLLHRVYTLLRAARAEGGAGRRRSAACWCCPIRSGVSFAGGRQGLGEGRRPLSGGPSGSARLLPGSKVPVRARSLPNCINTIIRSPESRKGVGKGMPGGRRHPAAVIRPSPSRRPFLFAPLRDPCVHRPVQLRPR